MPAPILVVDDDPGIRTVVQCALEDEGYRVVTAENGEEALTLLLQMRVSLVLLDLHMPRITGWEVHRRMREYRITVPVVYMTAGASARTEAERNHADGYLAKPFDLADLLDIAEQNLTTQV